jgi:hypothetical protein
MLNDVIAILLFQSINIMQTDNFNFNDQTSAKIIQKFFQILFLSSLIGLGLGKMI